MLNAKFTDLQEESCENLLEILELVRKIKAQDNLSIKSPIDYIEVVGNKLPDNLISDLKDVTSSNKIEHVQNLTSTAQNLQGKNVQINVMYNGTVA